MVPSAPRHRSRWPWPVFASIAVHALLVWMIGAPRWDTDKVDPDFKSSDNDEWTVAIAFRSQHDATLEAETPSLDKHDPWDPTKVTLTEPSPAPAPTVHSPAAPGPIAPPSVAVNNNPPENLDPKLKGSHLFPRAHEAKSVVFLVDRSISMGIGMGLPFAKREVLRALRALPAETTFEVLHYNQTVRPLRYTQHRELLERSKANLALAARIVGEMSASGSTHHARALAEGLLYRPACIYLVTDAGHLTWREVTQITERNRQQTALHIVELTSSPKESNPLLEALAKYNRGTYRRVPIETTIKASLAPLPR